MRFFFYGTLIAGSGNATAASAHALLRDLGPATATGLLHAVPDPEGWYPVLLPGTGTVHGRLYAADGRFDAAALARLDAYEDFDPAAPGASLYVRGAVTVTTANGSRGEAQAYRFNRPLPAGTEPIPGGDFWAWLGARGEAPFGGRRS